MQDFIFLRQDDTGKIFVDKNRARLYYGHMLITKRMDDNDGKDDI